MDRSSETACKPVGKVGNCASECGLGPEGNRGAVFSLDGILLAAAAPVASAAIPLERCLRTQGGPALLIVVTGFKQRSGTLRIRVYDRERLFLVRGGWIAGTRVEVPSAGDAIACLPIPGPGRFATIVRHDLNGNRRTDWGDGGGASRDPHVSIARLRPRFEEVAVAAGAGVTKVVIRLQYRQGWRIRPLSPGR